MMKMETKNKRDVRKKKVGKVLTTIVFLLLLR
jgi:hypothetical protein